MKRVEIQCPEALDEKEAALVDNHSLLNLLNVLDSQLETLGGRVRAPELQPFSRFCVDILYRLSQPEINDRISEIEERMTRLAALLRDLAGRHPEAADLFPGLMETLEVAATRLHEFRTDRYKWQAFSCEDFHKSLNQFLAATERVAKGRFHFVYPPEASSDTGYQIDFRVESSNDHIHSPLILQDTIRDLVGNARKYSEPGTTIQIRLREETPYGLRLIVSDEGCGIPEEEIEKVVGYGYRASNVQDRQTMGGGYGLTKAYRLCRKFGGRFFIESGAGKGTTVEMSLYPPG